MGNDTTKDVEYDVELANDIELGRSETIGGDRRPDSLRGMSQEEVTALNKKLVQKIDFIILPIIGILYILNYIDRQNLAAAKLQGIMEDLNMSTQQFATAVSILFVGYLPFQIPSNLLITKFPRPGLYICAAVVIWGGEHIPILSHAGLH